MGRAPINGRTAMSAADRKREQLARQWTRIMESDERQWTERDCLLILGSSRFEHGTPMDRAAWEQLGRLRGFDEVQVADKPPYVDGKPNFEVAMKYARMATMDLRMIHPSHHDREEAFDYVVEWIEGNR